MHISFDTATAKPAELAALSRFIQDLAALQTAPTTVTTPAIGGSAAVKPAVVSHSVEVVASAAPSKPDNLVDGVIAAIRAGKQALDPADRPDAGTLPADDLNAAAVFGGQRAAVAVPSVPVVPTVPAVPSAAAGPASVTAPPSTAVAPPAGVDVDKTGLPWDARIHASTKVKNADGTWRQRRGLNDEALLKRVEAELRATMALPAGVAAPRGMVAPAVPAPAAPPLPPAAVATEQYLAGTPVPPAPATFGEFIAAASNLVAAGKLSSEAVNAKLLTIGLQSVMSLANRPDLIPDAWRALHA